ncbi:SpoIIE family protein phosphatase [Streptomyces sp. NPDC057474]|uniref:SpoIIE family protein phosphatase n=1 Tax=Streptomyces sp. NPDC057474 TaxID=3346144 RepID=UPI0036B2E778
MMERLPIPERPDESDASPESAFTATATINEQGIVTGWSEGARRLLGYTASEVAGRTAAGLLADDVGETPPRPPGGRERCSGTLALRHRDGHRLELRLLAHRRTSDGGITEWLVVSAVAGKRRSPEEEPLREWTFSQSPDILAIFDTDLRLVAANARMERALSLAEAEMRGLHLPEIAPYAVSHETERRMRLALETGEQQYVEAYICATGVSPERGWSTSLAPLKDADGRVRAVCLTAHSRPEGYLARQRMLLLSDAGARIGTTVDIARTAQELADIAVPWLADFTAVDLLDLPQQGDKPASAPSAGPVTMRRTAVRSVLEGSPESLVAVGETAAYPALSPPAECLAAGHPSLYRMTDSTIARWAAQAPSAAWIREYGTHSMMIVPMRAHGITLGVVLFSRHQRREPFEPDDLLLAEELTARAAVSIHDARRYAQEHTSTITLQRSLLPHALPGQAALEIASRYLPTGTSAGVGGDWFDVIPLSGARVALVVGDVVGHGIRASATMGRLRTAVRTLADVDLPPDELLTHLDDLVIHLAADEGSTDPSAETAGGIGTTCLYAVYDPISRRCTLARAGHPPPAAVTPDGAVYFLDVPAGPPLGLGGLPFETFETELPEGSILALYTDGLLEARDHDIDEALDQLFAALSSPTPTLDTVCDRILTPVLSHRRDDDIALLIARTRALHADRVATWDLASDPVIVAQARKHATDQLTAWGLDNAAFITELTVSELVTNAIRYGQPPIHLRLIHENNTLICEVFDSSNTSPHLRRARTYDEGGRGLLLVAQLSDRWGTRHATTGKTIWAEQSLSAA